MQSAKAAIVPNQQKGGIEPVGLMLLGTPGMFIVLPKQSLPIIFRVGFSLD
jgi:hypothetical protein